MKEIDCHNCGICCEVLSISSLKKASYKKCYYLNIDNRCRIYETRPEVCRRYKADELCYFISDLDKTLQYHIFNSVYGEDG